MPEVTTAPQPEPTTSRWSRRTTVLGVIVAVALAVAMGLAWTRVAGGVEPTGRTTYVTVSIEHMRYSTTTIRVPAGNRLVITLRNADSDMVHDLVLDNGRRSPRLAPGRSSRIDVGVVDHDLTGWCSIPGHRQMGMTLDVVATGADGGQADHDPSGPSDPAASRSMPMSSGAAADLDLSADPGPGFVAHDARLPAAQPLPKRRVRRLSLAISEQEKEVAPGVRQKVWTFGGSAPGPVLHGQVGDTFVVTVANHGSESHGIDFHAGAIAPDHVMKPIPPGKSLVYRFTARRAGIWMYHCSSMPMSVHIANGMFGAVVIDPPGLPPVAHSYVLVQSEQYFGAQGGSADPMKVRTEQPDTVVFNGYADQYDHRPLPARVGQRVRVWVLDAGPSRATSFHVVGTQFDRVWSEGSYRLDGGGGGSQALGLEPAQGGFVEMTFPQPGHYPFVSHIMVDAERGAHGLFAVTR